MIVVAGAVEIRRHHRNEIGAVLTAIGLGQLHAGDLGDGVPLVGRLERAGQQRVLGHRLRRKPRIGARRRQEQELVDAGAMRAGDHIGFDHEVVVQEIDRLRVVRDNAADARGGDEHRVRLPRLDPCLDVGLPAQVELAARRRQALAILRRQAPHDRAAGHAAMAGDPDALAAKIVHCRGFHSDFQWRRRTGRQAQSARSRCRIEVPEIFSRPAPSVNCSTRYPTSRP